MLENAREYIGRTLSWKDIERLFPECYVALDDYYSSEDGVTAKLVYVCKNQKDMLDVLKKYAANGNLLHTRYTTESMEWNGLWQL